MDQTQQEFAALRAEAERNEAATLWADAAASYERALSVLPHDEASGADEVAMLTALGRCYWFDAQIRPAWRTLRRAIALARDRGDAAATARATVEILRIWGPPDRQLAMADEAIEALGEREPRLRAWLYLRTHRREEALAIGDQHGFEDVLESRKNEEAWRAIDEGRPEDYVPIVRGTHDTYARLGDYDMAAGQLRGLAFALLQHGRMSDGQREAEAAAEYARRYHLRFTEQLALMDLAGVAFAHNDFARCEALLDGVSADSDFRSDLYRMWMAQQRGDIDAAMRLLVDPAKGGGAPTAISQIHCAAAGMFFIAGQHETARRELREWVEAARPWDSFLEESPPITDCLVALGDDALIAEVHEAIAKRDAHSKLPDKYSTLQGRAIDPTRGALALRMGLLDQAEKHYRDGLAWTEAEAIPVDAGRCLAGLGAVARARGDAAGARKHFEQAASVFDEHGARYERKRVENLLAGSIRE